MTSALLALLLAAPCPTSVTFAPVSAQGASDSSRSGKEGLGQFSEMVGSTFVTLDINSQFSGWKIDLLHPRWQRVPSLGRGEANEELVAGGRLLVVWGGREKSPMLVFAYDPEKNAWARAPTVTPKTGDPSSIALKDWWLTSGFRFHPAKLSWLPMKASPQAGFSLGIPSTTSGNRASFFSPEDGSSAVYDADTDRWTMLPPGSPRHPHQAHVSPRTGRVAVLSRQEGSIEPASSGAVYDPSTKAWTPITGSDGVRFTAQPTRVGQYIVSLYTPGDPTWLLDIDAARWKLLPDPPFPPQPEPPPTPLVLLAGGETIFLSSVVCLDQNCRTTGYVGTAGRLQFYDPEQGAWCMAQMPPAVRGALGNEAYFGYEVLWQNHLLLWEASTYQDLNTKGMPWSAARIRIRSAPRGGVISW